MNETETRGTYACPICGLDEPHSHESGATLEERTFEYVVLGAELDEEESSWAYNKHNRQTMLATSPRAVAEKLQARHVIVRSDKGIVTDWWGRSVTTWEVAPGAGGVVLEQPSPERGGRT